jgi:predicted Zn-dependent protease
MIQTPSSEIGRGLTGQEQPDKAFLAAMGKILNAMNNGEASSARPRLLLLIEDHPATDFTEIIASMLENTFVYQGIAATLEDALPNVRAEEKNFVLYNLARVHYLRATTLVPSLRPPVLVAGAKVLAQIPRSVQDAALWEMAGDMETMRRNPESAQKYYARLAESGRSAAYAQYKTALSYLQNDKITQGMEGLQKALKAQGAVGFLRHRLYQEIAKQETRDRHYARAVENLMLSARVQQEKEKPFRLSLDVAQMLIQQGQGRLVLPYLTQARLVSPGDSDPRIAALEAQARRAR